MKRDTKDAQKKLITNVNEKKAAESSKQWLKTLNNNATATLSQTRQKRKKRTQTKQVLQSGTSFIAPGIKISASDSKRLNVIFALTLAAKGYQNSNLTRIDPEEYLRSQGRKVTKVNIRNARREIRDTIKNYRGISAETMIKRNGKLKNVSFTVFSMIVEDVDGGETATDGKDILFKYNDDFFKFFTNNGRPYIMFLPTALTSLDTKKFGLAWYVGYYLSRDERNNLHKKNQNRTNIVSSILREVGLIDAKGNSNSSVYSHVIEPLLRALDKLGDGSKFPEKNGEGLDMITYTFLDKKGNEVTNFKQLPLSEFKQYRLLVHWKKPFEMPIPAKIIEDKDDKE